MPSTWRSMVVCLIVIAAATGCDTNAAVTETSVAIPARDGVFIHISHGSDDPHRVLMALNMAVIMAADRDVVVYFDITGVEAVLVDAPDLTFGEFPSSHTQLTRLQELGVPLLACPGCLKAAGKTPDDLATGVRIADKEAFFSFTDGRILTLDY